MYKLRPGFQYIDKNEIFLKDVKDIVLMGDTGCTGFDEESKHILDAILKEKTDLFFILGDLVCSGSKEEFQEVIDFCNNKTKVPIFLLCGNHDRPDYYKVFGASIYALVLDKFVMVALDNSSSPFLKEDLTFLEGKLKKHKEKKFFILFHIPPPNELQASSMKHYEWQSLKAVLDRYKDRIECIFCAHIHRFLEYYLDGYHIFITGGGGAKMIKSENSKQSQHHAIRIDLKDKKQLNFEFIPVK